MKKLYEEVFENAGPADRVTSSFFTKTKTQVGEIPAGCDVKVTVVMAIVVSSVNSDQQEVGNPVRLTLTMEGSGIVSVNL